MRAAPAMAATVMQFFSAPCQVARLRQIADDRALTSMETINYMPVVERRETPKPAVQAINARPG